jgi:polyphosphate kinase
MSLAATVDDSTSKTNRTGGATSLAGVEYDLNDPALFINRDLSLLEFNWRVLEEAQKEIHPLLERVKFLAIYSSNMDEFFMIRVSGLLQQVAAGITAAAADGLSPAEQLSEIKKVVRRNLQVMNNTFFQLQTELGRSGVHLHHYAELTKTQKENVDEYFKREIFPVLTPLAVDPGRPFPHISSLSLNLAVIVRDPHSDKEYFARIKVPSILPRLIPVSRARGDSNRVYRFVWLEELIANNLDDLFPGYQVVEAHHFRITRNADLEIEANEASDLLEVIEATVRRRRFGFVARLSVAKSTPDYIRQILIDNLNVAPEDIFEGVIPLGLSSLMGLMAIDRPDLKDKPLIPVIPERVRKFSHIDEIFAEIRKKDILLHHPYDSFVPVVDFLKAAARDPKVVAIKQILYRAGANSPVVDALMEASENGKQVSAMVELKARFDEESNIGWAKALESDGVHVVYGFMSLKTHSKLCLVIRREDDTVRSYVHLGTGNYNASTAKIYVDLSLFTCKPEFGADAADRV